MAAKLRLVRVNGKPVGEEQSPTKLRTGFCRVQYSSGRWRRRHAPHYHCNYCRKKMKNKTGSCKKCMTLTHAASSAALERRKNGETHDINFMRCPLALMYGDRGRMYGTIQKRDASAWWRPSP